MQSPRRTPKVAGPRRDEFTEYPNALPTLSTLLEIQNLVINTLLPPASYARFAESVGLRAPPNRRGATYLEVGYVTA